MSATAGLLSPETALRLRQRPGERQTRPTMRRQNTRHAFQAKSSMKQMKQAREEQGVTLQSLYIGIAVAEGAGGTIDVGFASHDGTYSIDFAVTTLGGRNGTSGTNSGQETPGASGTQTPSGTRTPLPPEERAGALAEYLVDKIRQYQKEHLYKFVGAGLTKKAVQMSPQLPSKLWWELDIVPLVFEIGLEYPYTLKIRHSSILVDEEADSMARKCLMFFGPSQQPRVQVGYRNQVEVDCGGHAQITCAEQYTDTVGERTWKAAMKYAESLKKNDIQIAFFNSTPQGGGVALMRHALIRFLRLIGVNASWYVPKPKPEVFRITKNNHNILQGVANPELRLAEKQMHILDEWCKQNADRFWISEGGALAPRSQGGADVIIVDDPQMPSLVQIAKKLDPERPVIFRSHIQVRADLADQEGTPTSEVWNWVWDNVKDADVFISHPVREFVPNTVDFNKVGYMPATTDWLDGLNKEMSDWDTQFYIHEFEAECFKMRMHRLDFPNREYIVQIARFDPAKGIPDVLASYAELRRKYMKDTPTKDIPQLVIAGHGAIDDPDATSIYDQTLELLETKYNDVKPDVVVMRLGPTDQLLNALMSNAKVALQLSTREGFEVKVSEALHKGVPIIATKAGGIPLQVEHGKSGYLVEPGDSSTVAKCLHYLFTDHEAYDDMSEYAAKHVSDEVSTVGNALCWLYLADVLAKGKKIEPSSAWINDMAREEAELPYLSLETHLPRDKKLDLSSPVEK
ncbi:glycosyltransferase family 4 protein [Zopfia rhizophila CBS 207.26]|uniref:Glycosyltransferase family 4 protein n=1 Tax=Zopfia rhizophila CBS 207.26 TaxID=1314779 RepID=A0A6A6DB49_9PEZI|nr:glycosyltransferase family 4 protein [Zopfia rhizophila CBS 207.26]